MSKDQIDSRLEFAAFSADQRSALASAKLRIERLLPGALERFYGIVRRTPETARFFRDEAQLQSAKGAQQHHWTGIASAEFDAAYYASVRRIGHRHAKIGLEPRWYMGGYAILIEEMLRGLSRNVGWRRLLPGTARKELDLTVAVVKAALLDMELSVSIYFEESEAAQKTVVEALDRGLGSVAQGDLTAAIDEEFEPAYAAVKTNFNHAVASLRDLIATVLDSTETIRGGSGEIAHASEDLARRTESNAASLEETSAAVTQMDGRLKATAEAAARTVGRADQAIATVSGGRSIADEAVQAMGRVSDSAKGIDGVIEGLDKIAFQTRVLAMNAAVEAGRAGDAGRGFAVVADLVSALAMRAEEEAKAARDQLTVTQADIATAVDAVQKVDGALADISEGVGEVHTLLGQMANDNQAQSSAVTQISVAIGTMDQSTQQNAAMVEQTSAAARNLTNEVNSLSGQVTRFTITKDTGRKVRRSPVGHHALSASRDYAAIPDAHVIGLSPATLNHLGASML